MPERNPADLVTEIEARQDEVLQELDALNERIENVLSQFAPSQAHLHGERTVSVSQAA